MSTKRANDDRRIWLVDIASMTSINSTSLNSYLRKPFDTQVLGKRIIKAGKQEMQVLHEA